MVVIDMLKGKLSATSQNLCGALSSASASLNGRLSAGYILQILQEKVVIPGAEEQIITADAGYNGLSMVKVNPIPSNYGKITWNGIYLKVE